MKALRIWMIFLLLLPALQPANAQLAEVEVREPFIELHTSPGRSYPVFDIAERGERVQILKRRTGWFKIRTARNREGWVQAGQLASSLAAAGLAAAPAALPRAVT